MQAKNINVLAHFNAMNMISPGSGCEVHTASIDSQESLRRIAEPTPSAQRLRLIWIVFLDILNSSKAHLVFEAAWQFNQ